MQVKVYSPGRRFGLLLMIGSALFGLSCSQMVQTPEHRSDSVVVKENIFTEARTVGDTESGTLLFTSHMYPTAQPIAVQKLDPNHWIAVFEQPEKGSSAKVQIEEVSPGEFRVVMEKEID